MNINKNKVPPVVANIVLGIISMAAGTVSGAVIFSLLIKAHLINAGLFSLCRIGIWLMLVLAAIWGVFYNVFKKNTKRSVILLIAAVLVVEGVIVYLIDYASGGGDFNYYSITKWLYADIFTAICILTAVAIFKACKKSNKWLRALLIFALLMVAGLVCKVIDYANDRNNDVTVLETAYGVS